MLSEEMRQKEKKILSFVEEEHYHPIKTKEMAVLLCVPKKERGEFHEVLDSLILQGKIEIDKRGLIRLSRENIRTGTFMATRRGFGFVRVEEEKEDIFIPEVFCKNAFHGDLVQIRLTGESRRNGGHKEGEILRILERRCQRIVGTFTRNKKVTFVIPDQDKIGKDIYIPKGNTLDAVEGHKVVVELLDYGNDKKSPEGQVIQILGHINDPGVDILSVIRSYDLPEEFPEEVMHQTAGIKDYVDLAEAGERMDLRNLDTVTIDGEDAKDLDDAITIEKKEDGTYELGVHIADVSHYVTENSPLDKEAKKRGTSVYLVDRVIPMLPHKLSNGICSLNAGEDRFALSCIIIIDKTGKVIRHQIAETLIKVTERMNYSDVNDILTNHKPETCRRYENLIPMFETMQELAGILRKKRKKQGSIDFDFPECKIKLDQEGHPIDIVPYERNVATNIIEEFMLVANKVVAEEYFWLELPFIYRTHEYPDLEKIQELAKMTAGFGYHIKVGNEEVHPREIQKLIEQIEGSEEEAFLSRLTLRAMKRAKYSTINEGHFGLATKYYCHFTSPIRRYPDLQIHRIIKENIRQGIRERRFQHYEAILPETARLASDLERRADDAEREVEKMKKAEYMQDHIGETFEGIVSGVTSWGIYVELPGTVEGMVRLSDMTDDHYEFEEEKYRVLGHYSGREYRMGQKVKVMVAGVDKLSKTIDFEMVEGR
ncbi:MAG: ribonuclease R [Lachnospiraceae bacterium]|nr:ribonuclease R [Lachnospiraceae bacterium]